MCVYNPCFTSWNVLDLCPSKANASPPWRRSYYVGWDVLVEFLPYRWRDFPQPERQLSPKLNIDGHANRRLLRGQSTGLSADSISGNKDPSIMKCTGMYLLIPEQIQSMVFLSAASLNYPYSTRADAQSHADTAHIMHPRPQAVISNCHRHMHIRPLAAIRKQFVRKHNGQSSWEAKPCCRPLRMLMLCGRVRPIEHPNYVSRVP